MKKFLLLLVIACIFLNLGACGLGRGRPTGNEKKTYVSGDEYIPEDLKWLYE